MLRYLTLPTWCVNKPRHVRGKIAGSFCAPIRVGACGSGCWGGMANTGVGPSMVVSMRLTKPHVFASPPTPHANCIAIRPTPPH